MNRPGRPKSSSRPHPLHGSTRWKPTISVVGVVTWCGTREGDNEGIEAAGQTVESPGVIINRFEDGNAVEDINFWDTLEFFEQLGVMEPPGN